MSAYICSPEHFQTLAVFATSRGVAHSKWRVDPRYVKGLAERESGLAYQRGLENLTQPELASIYADILYQENIRSVQTRYPADTWDSLPGPIHKPNHIEVTGRHFGLAAYRLPPVAILKMCDGLEYQSCETEDWEQTLAFRLLTCIRKAAVRSLPGYEDAPWDYVIDTAKAA